MVEWKHALGNLGGERAKGRAGQIFLKSLFFRRQLYPLGLDILINLYSGKSFYLSVFFGGGEMKKNDLQIANSIFFSAMAMCLSVYQLGKKQ